ncbi:hypothetical protein BD779DRAFT_1509796 [Infundibulicybe gibba]|nr:hypothetical protein BD779DRAFT_1509796 [Infundibulicybe gibba]
MSSNTSLSPAGTPVPPSPAKSKATPARKTLKMARASIPKPKRAPRVPVVKAKPAAKAAAVAHPSWKDIISECIVKNKDDVRTGVGYGLDTSGGNIYQLNRAIASGVEGGLFVLPKGPSGKVKLAPKAKSARKRCNSKPAPSKAPATKAKAVSKPAPATKSKAAAKPVSKSKPKPATTSKPAVAKAKATPKKVLAGKPKTKAAGTKRASKSAKASVTGTTKTAHAGRKTPAKRATTKKPTATRGRK